MGQIVRVYESGRAALQYDLELELPTGKLSTVNVHVLPLTNSAERATGLVIVLDDVTNEKAVRRALSRYMADDVVEDGVARSEASGARRGA